MNLYLDSAYVAKCYLNEPDSLKVRKLVQRADVLYSSASCVAEVACAVQHGVREEALSRQEGIQLRRLFLEHVARGVWALVPLTEEFSGGLMPP